MEKIIRAKFDHVSKQYSLNRSAYGSIRDFIAELSRRKRDRFHALEDVSFVISAGENVGIIGINGSGKSTALKILARVTIPTSGTATVNGKTAALIQVGAGFHPEFTGLENIFLNGAIMGLTKKEIEQKLDEIVEFSELKDFLQTPVKYYSSGMYMRLGFSIAVHVNADILLIDEVLAVGDLPFQQKCIRKMDELKNSGKTIIFVSHNMMQVESLCDRVIWIDKGRIVKDGEASDVIASYISHVSEQQLEGKVTASGRFGSGEAKYGSASFINEGGQEIKEASKGERIGIAFNISAQKLIETPALWFSLINNEGIVIAGAMKNLSVLEQGENKIIAWINTNQLLPGPLEVRAAIFDQKLSPSTPIDHVGRVATINILSDNLLEQNRKLYGMMRLNVDWQNQERPNNLS